MRHILLSLIILLLLTSCEKDDPITPIPITPSDSTSLSTIKVNTWAQSLMEEVYLWESEIPAGLNPTTEKDAFVFFEKFLNTPEDRWSWLSDNYFETNDLYSGITTTAGYEYSLSLISDNYSVIGIIEYSLPGSPADLAGIKRGDIFTGINGKAMNIDNYYELITQGGSYSIQFAEIIRNKITPTDSKNITEVSGFQENPILLDSIYTIEGKTIGYLVYNGFIATFNNELSSVFGEFKAAGVTDFILDLRYNSGGSVQTEELMANLIAPQSSIGEIFSTEHWNELYTAYWKQEYGSDVLNARIKSVDNNIDLSGKFIGLTSSLTASASEGVLNGLSPLTNLTLIGDTTHGKHTSIAVFPDNDSIWAAIPVIAKSTNKDNISVMGGMAPNLLLDDDPLDGYQLGDTRETMLSKALEEITGTPVAKSVRIQPQLKISKKIGSYKNNQKITAQPCFTRRGKVLHTIR